jgi:cellulose biosynthesis protein BcsQ
VIFYEFYIKFLQLIKKAITMSTILSKFKQDVESLLSQAYKGIKPAEDPDGWYDYVAGSGENKKVVVVKNQKSPIRANFIAKLTDLKNQDNCKALVIISSSGYFDTVFDYLDNNKVDGALLYVYDETSAQKIFTVWDAKNGRVNLDRLGIVEKINAQTPEKSATPKPKRVKKSKSVNIGVFTSKGGVGKTTISAHLAGALSIMGYDTALIDLDPQSNLKRLIGNDGIYIPNARGGAGNTLSVLSPNEWVEEDYKEIKAIVCDCNPEIRSNPDKFVKKFDFCIIPITLNPLGISKHAHVISRTVEAIRLRNKKAKFLVLVNQYRSKEGAKNKKLLDILDKEIAKIKESEPLIELLLPSEVAIRDSDLLHYWGMHTIEQDEGQSELAFAKVGGKSMPKDDFFALAEFVVTYTSIKD